jgi:hypothetical protein
MVFQSNVLGHLKYKTMWVPLRLVLGGGNPGAGSGSAQRQFVGRPR